jgi:hypothetical protein
MNSRIAIFCLVAVILGEILLLLYSQKQNAAKRPKDRHAEVRKLGEPMPKWEAAAAVKRHTKLELPEPELPQQPDSPELPPIQKACRGLQSSKSKTDVLAILELKLLAHPPTTSIQQILAFLKTGEDCPTGSRLVPGEERLDSAPSIRVALLDLLGRLCRKTNTREAADVGRELLQTLDSADEFAVSLRNVAWIEPDATGYLGERLDALLAYAPWKENPTGGFVAALDAAAFLGESKRLIPLEELAKSEPAALQHSAQAAMERLCEFSPLDALRLLNRKTHLLAGLPKIRATLFTKADFSHPDQRKLVETYLDRPDVDPSEKVTFVEELWRLPANTAPTLFTRRTEPLNEDVRNKRTLTLVSEWLASNQFKPLHPNLEALQRRLTSAKPDQK